MSCSVDHLTIKSGGFCTGCGLRIEHIEPRVHQSAASVSYCPNGHVVPAQKKFCETCGALMVEIDDQINTNYSNGGISAPPPSSGAGFAALPHPNDLPRYPMPQPKKTNTGLFIGLGVGGLVFFVVILSVILTSANLGSGSSGDGVFSPSTTTVSVTMSIDDEYCDDLSWGYNDIPGGAIILSVDGVATGFANYSYYGTDTSTGCDFDAYFYGIPTNGTFYSLRMASGLRGTIENDKSEMEYNGWHFDVSLG